MSRLIYISRGLASTPPTLTRMVARIDPSKYDERLSEDRFTLREVLAHMADLEPVVLQRIELALCHPGAQIDNWDQDKEAIEKDYPSWQIEPTLAKFAAAREKTVAKFESLSEEQLALTLNHPILGQITLYELLTFILGHDCYHFEQVSQYL